MNIDTIPPCISQTSSHRKQKGKVMCSTWAREPVVEGWQQAGPVGWLDGICTSFMSVPAAGITLAQKLTSTDFWSYCAISSTFFISISDAPLAPRNHQGDEIDCNDPVTEGNGKAELVWPVHGYFLTAPVSLLVFGGYFKIDLSCTRLIADAVWLQAHWCHEATVTTLPCVHSPKGFDMLKKI